MSNKSGTSSQVISLPKGGGAMHGMGEKFSPDLHTGTGNFTVPIAIPAGRNGFQPQLNLVYSTGNGNGVFGLGWSLSIPGVSRQTFKGIPKYDDEKDIFVLSGAEDLVPVEQQRELTRYQPRTEGLFAKVVHHRDTNNNYWEVRSKDGLISQYGTPGMSGIDPAVIAKPDDRSRIFAWKLTRTIDPFGNRIDYIYERDLLQKEGSHYWDQLYLSEIRYVDYGNLANPDFLVRVKFTYEDRPDPFSDYRAGFEIRTIKRCNQIEVFTKPSPDPEILTHTHQMIYLDRREGSTDLLPLNKSSLLSQFRVEGHDEENPDPKQRKELLPPLEFSYSRFDPKGRDFSPVVGADLPPGSLARSEYELADLFGNGLPDILEMNGTVRYWRNLGNGKFDRPREMKDAPAGLRLADSGVQMIDADGDGRIDLLVTTPGLSGYFPLRFGGLWDRKSFQRYDVAPSINLEDPEVKLVDLTGDGVTDAIRSGSRMECFFNDPKKGWKETRWIERQALDKFPNVNFSDPRVKWGDMTGDGLQDILLVHDGNIQYWPNLGYGEWGDRISMKNSPRFRYGYDPRRILVGDVDGDGLADIVYVDDKKVILWINQSGNGWSDPIEIKGTPAVSDLDAVRLIDLLGTGVAGVLWSADAGGLSRQSMFFLDFTGGVKPYLLNEMDNHMGSLTRVGYRPSIQFYLEDEKRPETRWKTPLPFPVQVVAKVEVIDRISSGKLTTEYSYHHGYWDGAEREFRGFGRVEQRDTQIFEEFQAEGLHPDRSFAAVTPKTFSPPLKTRTWFHQGSVGDEFGDWYELDYRDEFWIGDPQVLSRPQSVIDILRDIENRRAKRDALRSLRGSVLRTELYALDGKEQQDRPYTVMESIHGVRVESPLPNTNLDALPEILRDRQPIFFSFALAERTTQWERGEEPMTQFKFMGEYDSYGQLLSQIGIAVPRGRDFRVEAPTPQSPYLSTYSETKYAQRDDPLKFIINRVAQTTSYEVLNDGRSTVFQLWERVKAAPASRKIIGQTLNFYDGDAFQGLGFGQIGDFGALVRSLTLVMTEEDLQAAYEAERPPYLSDPVNWTADYPQEFRDRLPALAGYVFQSGGGGLPFATGYFAIAERRSYDFHIVGAEKRGLPVVMRDPLGRDATIEYDEPGHPYRLLPVKVTDPVGMTTQAKYNYRVMQPKEVIDPNDNRTTVTFTPLGLLASTFVKGKGIEGDRDRPSILMEYGFLAYENSPPENRQPIFVRSIRQIHHDTEIDVLLPKRDETITTVEYSDGFGRLLQTRVQAEDITFGNTIFGDAGLPGDQTAANQDAVGKAPCAGGVESVVVSGWQTYDNKGKVVEKYEPFFDCGWNYTQPTMAQMGQKVTMFYDPRGQVIRTLNPDGSEQRVIYGIPEDLANPEEFKPTPWEAYTYDANDNAGRTHATDPKVQQYEHHWNTPASMTIDALGRTISAIERNRAKPANAGDLLPPIEEYRTRSQYDIRGNVLTITDALGRKAFEHFYDLANRNLRIESIDAGTRRTVLDVLGNPVEQRDGKGALTLHSYDRLNRPTLMWARDGVGQAISLRSRSIYGDSPESGLTTPQAKANNLLGKPYRNYDEAGLVTLAACDFKGNVLSKVQQVIRDEQILGVFNTAPANNWQVSAYRVNWQPGAGVTLDAHASGLLEAKAYTTSMEYDALNRLKVMRYPQDVNNVRQELRPEYNRAGALKRVNFDNAVYVDRIAYNAKGQRVLIAYGNGVMTRQTYDLRTFRLVRMRSDGYTKLGELTYRSTGAALQDFAYEYDLVGNISVIHDRTPRSGVANNALVGADALDRVFSYDPLYRLLSATGRECQDIPQPRSWVDEPRCDFNSGNHGTPGQDNAPNLTALYREEYAYDAAGNMLGLRHQQSIQAGGGARWETTWSRLFGMGGLTPDRWDVEWRGHLVGNWPTPPSNRLTHVADRRSGVAAPPVVAQSHFFDVNGNLVRENSSRHFEWDYGDRLRVFRTQTGTAEPSVHAHYLYDASGQRVKKLVRKQGGQVEVTVYIDGVFEYQRIVRGGVALENNTLHVIDGQSRVALVRVGNAFPDDTTPAIKYFLGDHLGSSNLVIDRAGSWVNREEYTPYGETSFGSFARKRYRFTGKERDEESGLNYHGARYYIPCLTRWASCDPAGIVDGLNLYHYVNHNPLKLTDPSGLDGESLPGGVGRTSEELANGAQPQMEREVPKGGKDAAPAAMPPQPPADTLSPQPQETATMKHSNTDRGDKPVSWHVMNLFMPGVMRPAIDPRLPRPMQQMQTGIQNEVASGAAQLNSRLGVAASAPIAIFALLPSVVVVGQMGIGGASTLTTTKLLPIISGGGACVARNPNLLQEVETEAETVGPSIVNRYQQLASNFVNGNLFQTATTNSFGLTRNTTTMLGQTTAGSWRATIVDVYAGGQTPMADIKDVLRISLSPQLQAQINVAQMTGVPYSLITSPRTQYISQPLINAVLNTGGFIFQVNPSTGSVNVFDNTVRSWTSFF